ncbi:MAG TPA: hypothetical protein VEI97_02285, partial [bacterium]|nr:hypothetical protein [bacterium]
MRCAFPIALPLILLALACPKSAARPPASDLAATAARALFTEHRRALPRVPVQVPYPMDEKYWTYARGIDLPPRAELLQELRSAFATAPEPERYVIARHLLELGAPPADSDLAALDRRMAAFLRGESSVEDLPNIRVFLDYLHARRKQLELGPFLAQFQHGEPLLITVDPDDTAAGFERYARAQRDLLRLR